MNDDHDPIDETLAGGLRALAPPEFELDADRALGSLRPALRHARARRRLAVSTLVLGVFVVVAAGATVLQRHPASHVNIQAHASSTVSTPHARSTTTVVPRSTTTSVAPSPPPPPALTPTTTPDHHTGTTTRGPIVGGGPPPGATTPVTKTPPTTRNTTTTLPAPGAITYRSGGGRITITFAGGRLKLDSYVPAAGYTAEVHTDTASEIEVRFSNDTDHLQSRVRVRVKDGRLEPEIDNS